MGSVGPPGFLISKAGSYLILSFDGGHVANKGQVRFSAFRHSSNLAGSKSSAVFEIFESRKTDRR